MKRKKLLLLFASTCLVLVLAVSPFMAACAAPAVEPGVAPEVAALEKEVAALEKKVTAAEKGKAASEKEVAALEKEVAAAEKEIAAAEKEIAKLKEPVPAKKYTFRLQASVVSETAVGQTFVSHFQPKLTELSQGLLEVEWYDLKTLVPNNEALESVKTGVIDMWSGGCGYYQGAIGPVASFISGAPYMWDSYQEWATLFKDLGLWEIEERMYEPHGVHFIGSFRSSPYMLIISTVPIESLEDVRQLKLRVYGMSADFWDKLGASTCYIPGGELYTSLATGVIDAAEFGGPAYNWPYGFYEVAKYRFGPCGKCNQNDNIMRQDVWEELPDNLKWALEGAFRYWEPAIARLYDYTVAEAVRKMVDDHGVTIVEPSEANKAEMLAAAMVLWEEVAGDDPLAQEVSQILIDYKKHLGKM